MLYVFFFVETEGRHASAKAQEAVHHLASFYQVQRRFHNQELNRQPLLGRCYETTHIVHSYIDTCSSSLMEYMDILIVLPLCLLGEQWFFCWKALGMPLEMVLVRPLKHFGDFGFHILVVDLGHNHDLEPGLPVTPHGSQHSRVKLWTSKWMELGYKTK